MPKITSSSCSLAHACQASLAPESLPGHGPWHTHARWVTLPCSLRCSSSIWFGGVPRERRLAYRMYIQRRMQGLVVQMNALWLMLAETFTNATKQLPRKHGRDALLVVYHVCRSHLTAGPQQPRWTAAGEHRCPLLVPTMCPRVPPYLRAFFPLPEEHRVLPRAKEACQLRSLCATPLGMSCIFFQH